MIRSLCRRGGAVQVNRTHKGPGHLPGAVLSCGLFGAPPQVGRRFAPSKRFRRRRKPWRRGGFAAPSISIQNGDPGGPWPAGDGRQGPLRASDSSGGAVQVNRTHKGPGPLPGARSGVRPLRGPTAGGAALCAVQAFFAGVPTRAQRSGSCGESRSKGADAVFAVRRKRSQADFATTRRRGGFAAPSIPIQNGDPGGPWPAGGRPPRPATSITRQGPIPSRAKRLGMGEEAQRRE